MMNFLKKILESLRAFILGKNSVEITVDDIKESSLANTYVSVFRQDNGLLPLSSNHVLVQIAQEHSKYMAKYQTLSAELHPLGLDFKLRFLKKSCSYRTMIVVKTTGKAEDFATDIRSHQDSRAKLLSGYYDEMGICVCEGFWALVMTSKN